MDLQQKIIYGHLNTFLASNNLILINFTCLDI